MEAFVEIAWLPQLDTMLRLVCAAVLSACIGVEREFHGHPAGLRTHMLVGLSAGLFTVVAIDLAGRLEVGTGFGVDPLRAIEAVTAGVAFVAAGAIIRSGDRVRNLTTGAGLWTAGAIGLACGAGYLGLAAFVTALALFILVAFAWLERLF